MRVCKHGCDVRSFAFRANHASTNLKQSKLDKFTLFTLSFVVLSLENLFKQAVSTKKFCVFSQESYFIKAVENFFPVFA